MPRLSIVACLFSSLLAACTAVIDGPSEPPGSASASPGALPSAAGAAGTAIGGSGASAALANDFALAPGVGAQPRLWRLTEKQYRNAVQDLLNVAVTTPLPGDDGGSGFGNRADLLDVSQALLEAYSDAAEAVANQLIPARLGELLKCPPLDATSAACVESFIRGFGARAWRRPLADDEVASLLALHADVTRQLDGNAGVSALVQAFLTSPKFLFRFEVGEALAGSSERRLTPFEVATALSFGYWNTAPDNALLDAARSGELAAPADIEARVRAMLDDPRAKDAATDFVEKWLGIDGVGTRTKSAALFPSYSPALMQAIESEARLLAGSALWDGAGLRELLTSSSSFVDSATAPLYGLSASPGAPQRTNLNPAQRLGILTQAAFLAAHASEDTSKPVLRGKFVRENLLCQAVPAPPPNVNVDVPTTGANQTARERFTQHARDPSCSGCHEMFDGLGFAFENYDALGRYRTRDNGKDIDASGSLLDPTTGAATPFTNALELVQTLASSEQTYRCFTQKLFESLNGREPVQGDAADLVRAHAAFHDAGYDVKKLLAALAVADGFLSRHAE
jgi:hypothetical protein